MKWQRMDKITVGDKVRAMGRAGGYPNRVNKVGIIRDITNSGMVQVKFEGLDFTLAFNAGEIARGELVVIKEGDNMSRRKFKLIQELPELRKGAIVEEACDDGTQDYEVLDESHIKYKGEDGKFYCCLPREAVENEPKWFVEVFPASEVYLTKSELSDFEKFLKGKR